MVEPDRHVPHVVSSTVVSVDTVGQYATVVVKWATYLLFALRLPARRGSRELYAIGVDNQGIRPMCVLSCSFRPNHSSLHKVDSLGRGAKGQNIEVGQHL